jgi:hypothetical protein
MDGQLSEVAPSNAAQAWGCARRLREPIAWALLALAAIGLLIGAWELLNLPGTPPIATPTVASAPAVISASPSAIATPANATAPHPVPAPHSAVTFGVRASAVAPQFVADDIFALPIISVLLVAFAGGLTVRARPVVETAIGMLAVTLGLGLLTWLGALSGHVRADIWFITDARQLAIVAAGLIFTIAVRRSRALRLPTAQGEDLRADDDDFEVLGTEVSGVPFEDYRDE